MAHAYISRFRTLLEVLAGNLCPTWKKAAVASLGFQVSMLTPPTHSLLSSYRGHGSYPLCAVACGSSLLRVKALDLAPVYLSDLNSYDTSHHSPP